MSNFTFDFHENFWSGFHFVLHVYTQQKNVGDTEHEWRQNKVCSTVRLDIVGKFLKFPIFQYSLLASNSIRLQAQSGSMLTQVNRCGPRVRSLSKLRITLQYVWWAYMYVLSKIVSFHLVTVSGNVVD